MWGLVLKLAVGRLLVAIEVGAVGKAVVAGTVGVTLAEVVGWGVAVVPVGLGSCIPPCRPIPRVQSSSCWDWLFTQRITEVSFSASFR